MPPSGPATGNKPGKNPGEPYPAEGPNDERKRSPMSLSDISNPTGGMPGQRVVDQLPFEQHLLERIFSSENLQSAWKRVRSNKGAPGVDGTTIETFPDRFRPLWSNIRASLMAGTYQPKPVLRVEIPKPTGGTRPLGIPTVLDRLIQQAMAQVLTPIFDPEFSESSFGFRPGRSAHRPCGRCKGLCVKGTALPWMSIFPPSLRRSTMTCS